MRRTWNSSCSPVLLVFYAIFIWFVIQGFNSIILVAAATTSNETLSGSVSPLNKNDSNGHNDSQVVVVVLSDPNKSHADSSYPSPISNYSVHEDEMPPLPPSHILDGQRDDMIFFNPEKYTVSGGLIPNLTSLCNCSELKSNSSHRMEILQENAKAVHTLEENLKAKLGRATWTVLHLIAAYYPLHPTPEYQASLKEWILMIPEFYPCRECAQHMREMFKAFPPKTDSEDSFGNWLCECHNMVNRRLHKPHFPCSEWRSRWRLSGSCESTCRMERALSMLPNNPYSNETLIDVMKDTLGESISEF